MPFSLPLPLFLVLKAAVNIPTRKRLKRLQQTGCLILRTDEKGEITIFTDGKTIWYTTEK